MLGFAVFFALVLKKVDQEEYGDPPIDGSGPNAGTYLLLLFIKHLQLPWRQQQEPFLKMYLLIKYLQVQWKQQQETCF